MPNRRDNDPLLTNIILIVRCAEASPLAFKFPFGSFLFLFFVSLSECVLTNSQRPVCGHCADYKMNCHYGESKREVARK